MDRMTTIARLREHRFWWLALMLLGGLGVVLVIDSALVRLSAPQIIQGIANGVVIVLGMLIYRRGPWTAEGILTARQRQRVDHRWIAIVFAGMFVYMCAAVVGWIFHAQAIAGVLTTIGSGIILLGVFGPHILRWIMQSSHREGEWKNAWRSARS